jgi:hypothetical protein
MPRSKARKKKSGRESRAKRQRALEEETLATKHKGWRAKRRERMLGWSLVGVAVVVGVSHLLTHVGVWGFASQGVMDLVAGYPMAALLGITGAIVLGRD